MFKDMNISKDLMVEFKEQHPEVDMTVNVLSRGMWPEWPIIDVNLPNIFLENQRTFEHFYDKKYNGRKLTWQNSKAHCVLTARYEKGNKTFCTSLFQTIVLLQFNNNSKLTYKELRENTGISK